MQIKKSFYHQVENTNHAELTTYVYDYNSWEFNSPHFHKNLELLIVINGNCQYTVGNESFEMQTGDAIFVLPFQVHHFTVGEGATVRCLCFTDLLILTLAKQFDKKKLQCPLFRPSEAVVNYFLNSMDQLFGKRYGANRQIPQAKRMKLKGLLYTIGGEVIEQTVPIDVGGADMVVMDVINYIADNFKSNISLHDVADAKGYNYQYLSRIFNRTFGINFKTMLNQYRTNHALELLRDSHLPLSEIAFESGFQSIRSFDHIFRERFGKAPKEFRKQN
ncbi:MAG: helix-turn-helix domain-containing protein [Ruminococcaceae bacterium]|nr:helix-turn-helix domain-containing protein [Oscillospiraceae bacterium]